MIQTKTILCAALGAVSLILCGCGGPFSGPCFAADDAASSVAPCGPDPAACESVGSVPLYEPSEIAPCAPADVATCTPIEAERVVCSGGVCRVVAPSTSPCERRAASSAESFSPTFERTFERTLKRSSDRERVRDRIAARSAERRSRKSGGCCLKRLIERNRSERVRFDVGAPVAPCGPIE